MRPNPRRPKRSTKWMKKPKTSTRIPLKWMSPRPRARAGRRCPRAAATIAEVAGEAAAGAIERDGGIHAALTHDAPNHALRSSALSRSVRRSAQQSARPNARSIGHKIECLRAMGDAAIGATDFVMVPAMEIGMDIEMVGAIHIAAAGGATAETIALACPFETTRMNGVNRRRGPFPKTCSMPRPRPRTLERLTDPRTFPIAGPITDQRKMSCQVSSVALKKASSKTAN